VLFPAELHTNDLSLPVLTPYVRESSCVSGDAAANVKATGPNPKLARQVASEPRALDLFAREGSPLNGRWPLDLTCIAVDT